MRFIQALGNSFAGLLLRALLLVGCSGDVSRSGDEEAARAIREAVFADDTEVDVDVHAVSDEGRHVELSFTGAAADQLGMDAVVPADSVQSDLKRRAKAVARRFKRQYDGADAVEQLEIAFVERASLGGASVSVGPTIEFTGSELADL